VKLAAEATVGVCASQLENRNFCFAAIAGFWPFADTDENGPNCEINTEPVALPD
jgi:hypothetical protein